MRTNILKTMKYFSFLCIPTHCMLYCQLKGIKRRYLRPPKSATAADGVIRTAMKSCIQNHQTHLDQRPLRPPKLNNAVLVWSSFGGLRGLWSGYVRCLCAFSWLFQWQYRWPWPTSAAGDSFAPRADLCHQYSLPVSTTPLINFSAVSATPAIRESCQY